MAKAAKSSPSRSPSVSRETPSGPVRLAIINQKGGVGKTTSAVSLAADLSERGYRTLLVDMDPQGNASTALGVDRHAEDTPTAYDLMFEDDARPDPLDLGPDRPFLYAANSAFVRADLDLIALGEERRNFVLRDALAEKAAHFDFVLYDAPPSLSLLTINILIASDGVIVPVQCEYLALEGLITLMGTLEEIRREHHPALRTLGCVITMADMRTNLSQQIVADMRDNLGAQVFQAMIPRSVRLAECPSHGQTIFEYERWGAGARSYRALCSEILERLGKPANSPRAKAAAS
ncbi:MAG: ParA family protein [Sumerlaeia bacterium]